MNVLTKKLTYVCWEPPRVGTRSLIRLGVLFVPGRTTVTLMGYYSLNFVTQFSLLYLCNTSSYVLRGLKNSMSF